MQPSVVKADEGKAEEQAVVPAQPQAGTEGESGAQTEKGSKTLVQLILVRQIQLR